MAINNVPQVAYTEQPSAAFPSTDMSNQGPSGTTATMVNSIESMRNFGAGK
jgi:hypothetical protein